MRTIKHKIFFNIQRSLDARTSCQQRRASNPVHDLLSLGLFKQFS